MDKSDDHLAEWLSEFPLLRDRLWEMPNFERYMRRHKPPHTQQKVSDDEWTRLVQQMT